MRFKIFKNNNIEALENEINEYVSRYVNEVTEFKSEHYGDTTIVYMLYKPSKQKIYEEMEELDKKMLGTEEEEHFYKMLEIEKEKVAHHG